MIVCLLRTWGVWFLAVQLVKAEVTLENGAYRNIVVSFSSNLQSDEGENIVKNTKDLLVKTSLVLQKTLGVSIGQVTFALPDDWEVSGYDSGSIPRVDEPDILVDNREGSPFGKGPFAEQYGGCGVRGTHINVPYSFLTSEETYPREKLLAREWLKFRYGVFDEHGFPGDSKYPDHYTVHGDEENVKVTECTDPAVEYLIKNSNNETCSLGEENCKIYLGDGAEGVKSSLMYFHEELKNVDQVCGKEHQHNFMGPSKQNILCSERSIWDVLNESGELKDREPTENPNIEYKFVKFSKPKMLILLEATSPLKPKKEEITFALQRVLFDLPEGTHLGVKTFIPGGTREVRPFSELGEDRSLSIGASFDAPSDNVCPLCVLEENVDELPKNEPGLIVLITASSPGNTKDNNALLEKLKNSQHILLLITLTDDGVSLLDGYGSLLKELMHLNQAYLSEIKSSKIELLKALYTDIMSHFPFSHTDPLVEIVYNGIISNSDVIEIPENQLTEEVTIWIDKSLDPGQLECIDKNGANFNRTEIEKSSLTRVIYKAEGSVSCILKYGEEKIMVQVTKPKSSESEYIISAKTWVHDTTPTVRLQQADSKVQMPVIIYAKINYESYPVSLANVEAVVKDDEEAEKKFLLKDDGKGDPDITMGDGIYSGYFFEFTKEGSYNVKVQIKTDASQAKAIKIGNDRCCGTQVEPHEESTVPAFEKTVSTVFSAISSKPENGYPPAKILDLRVTKFEPPSVLELSWTAPGGEVDQGNATHYEIKVFCDSSSHCQENGSFPGWISPSDSLPTPGDPGQIQTVQLSLFDSAPQNTTLRITMETVRETESSGLSNSVRIWLKDEPEDPPTTTTVVPTRKNHAIAVGNVIGWTVVGILVVFCIGGLVYFLVTKKRRLTQKETANPSELDANCTKRSNSFRISEGKRADSFPVLLYTHNQVKDVRERTRAKDPPLYRAGAPPKPWVSMGELGGGRKGSQGSDSTARVDDGSAEEMKELDASSLDVQLNVDGKEVKL